MFDELFRTRFATTVRPLARTLAAAGLTGNHLTVVSLVLASVAAGLLANGRPFAGLALWLASRIGDGLDGLVAREAGKSSPFGGFLDITLDMAAYSFMVIAFAIVHPELRVAWLCVLAGYVLVITTTLALSDSARAAGRGVSDTNRTFQFTAGLTEAGETNAMYTLWILFPAHVHWLVWIWIAALAATTVQRTLLACRELR